jgi:hypothetical protein
VPAVGDFSCLAVDTQNVYVATGLTALAGGQIYAVPLNGGAPQTIVPGQSRPHGIASDGLAIFWVDYGSGDVMTAGIGGSNPTPIVTGQASPWDIAVDANHIYWSNQGDGTVWQAAKDGGQRHLLASGLTPNGIGYLAVDAAGANVYFTDRGAGNALNPGAIYVAPVDGTATGTNSPQAGPGVAVDDTDVFFSSAAGGTILTAPLPLSPTAPTAIEHNRMSPNAMATDGTFIYWSQSVANGSIDRASVSGGQVTQLAMQQNFPTCIAIDTTSIYWINSGGGAVSKTAR